MSVLTAVMAQLAMLAAPALPGVWQVKQADGTLLSVEQFGDEYHHWTATTDGVLVVNTGKGYYVAAIDEDGQLQATDILAHEPAMRNAAEKVAVSRQQVRHALFHERGQQQGASIRRAASVSDQGGYFPHTGNPRVLAILVEYQDISFTIKQPLESYEQYLNGTELVEMGNKDTLNYSSVAGYFETSSNGQFRPVFDVVGPVQLPHESAYYGGTSATAGDEKMGELSRDAIDLVKETTDLSVYDNDGDGVAELIYIIFAGYGQNAGGAATTMWAKVSTQNLTISDDLKVRRVGCSSELFNPAKGETYDYSWYINGIGVFCHEFSHAMGLPDLYPTTKPGRLVNNQSMEYWDIMDMGGYTYNGFAPKTYLAWEQEAMGWKEIETLDDSQNGVEMKPVTEEDGKAYRIPNPLDDNEFIVLENVQQAGANYKIFGHGLLAYHVAYPRDVVNMGDSPNNTAGKPAVAVIPADGLLISTYQCESYNTSYGGSYTTKEYRASLQDDPFPGTSEVAELTDENPLPNYHFYSGESVSQEGDEEEAGEASDYPVGSTVRNIHEDEETGIVVFDYDNPLKPIVDGVQTLQLPQQAAAAWYDLQGRRLSGTPTQKGIYLSNGKSMVR